MTTEVSKQNKKMSNVEKVGGINRMIVRNDLGEME